MESSPAPSLITEIQALYATLIQAHADAQYFYDQFEHETQAAYDQRVAQINAEAEQQIAAVQRISVQRMAAASRAVSTSVSQFGLIGASWKDSLWDELIAGQLTPASDPPDGLRIGSLSKSVNGTLIEIPALLPLIGSKSILVVSRDTARSAALSLGQSLAIRAILTFPPGMAQFTFIDPKGLGDNFPFKDVPTPIRGEAIYAEQDEIQVQLRALTDHIRQVNQNRLGQEFKSLEAYNAQADSAEQIGYRLLCITDFPAQFDPETMARLVSIVEKGPRCGVYTIVHVDSEAPLPAGFSPDPLLAASSVIFGTSDGFTFSLAGRDYEFSPDGVPDAALFHDLMQTLHH